MYVYVCVCVCTYIPEKEETSEGRPTIEAKETYYRGKRDLLYTYIPEKEETSEGITRLLTQSHAAGARGADMLNEFLHLCVYVRVCLCV